MIGLLVQLTADLAKIWSTSSHRFISFKRDDVPNDCLEGHWIEIEFDSSRVMRGMKRAKDSLETRKDETRGIQVLDVFMVDSRREEAFSETFGVVRIERGKGGGRWTEEGKTKDQCFHLWMTISSKPEFLIEEQSLDKSYSKNGEYSKTYNNLMKEFPGVTSRAPINDVSDECMDVVESIVIVGYDPKARVYFSCSRTGEAYIDYAVWKRLPRQESMVKGAIFRAKIEKNESADKLHKIVELYETVNPWNGVYIKDMVVELDAIVVERRKTCFAIETEPFGLVTYPLDKDFLAFTFSKTDIDIGATLRVALRRFKDEMKDDHPSKWQVTRVIKVTKREEKKDESEWFEGVVTGKPNPVRSLITFKLGSAAYTRNARGTKLSLGDIVNMRVEPGKNEGWFEVVEISENTRAREDLIVEPFKDKCNVYCTAKVIERCKNYFLLDTPIIGLALFFFKDAPRVMEVGDVWRVKMLRKKDRENYPTFWLATEVVGDAPRVSSSVSRSERDTVDHSSTSGCYSRDSLTSTSNVSLNGRWTTVLITGSEGGLWYACCAQKDPIRIPKNLNRTGKDMEKGAFYRILLSKSPNGVVKVHDLDTERVYPKDYDFVFEKNESIKLWCYAQIVDVQESAFTVHNELIGDATLPFKRATNRRSMRVGDWLETLYYRVKTTDNPTHWMVEKVVLARSGYGEKEGEVQKGSADSYDEERREEAVEEGIDRPVDTKSTKDGRVLEIMHRYMKIADVRELIMKQDPEALDKIMKILAKNMQK